MSVEQCVPTRERHTGVLHCDRPPCCQALSNNVTTISHFGQLFRQPSCPDKLKSFEWFRGLIDWLCSKQTRLRTEHIRSANASNELQLLS